MSLFNSLNKNFKLSSLNKYLAEWQVGAVSCAKGPEHKLNWETKQQLGTIKLFELGPQHIRLLIYEQGW